MPVQDLQYFLILEAASARWSVASAPRSDSEGAGHLVLHSPEQFLEVRCPLYLLPVSEDTATILSSGQFRSPLFSLDNIPD